MADTKEFIVIEFKPGMAAKLEKLYNEGYRKYRHMSNDKHTYIFLKKK